MSHTRQTSRSTAVASAIFIGLLFAAIAEASGDASQCEVLNRRIDAAVTDLKAGKKVEGETTLGNALALAQAQECFYQEARACGILGWLYTREGRLAESLHRLAQGLQAIHAVTAGGDDETTSQGQLEALLQHNLGALLVRLAQPDLALDRLQRAQLLYRRFGASNEDRTGVLLQISRTQRLLGNPREAEASIKEAIHILPDENTRVALEMERARLLIDAERFDEASTLLDWALNSANGTGDVRSRANVLADRAELEVRRQNWSRAVDEANRGLALAAASGLSDPNMLAHTHYAKSVALLELEHFEEAKQAADAALSRLEHIRDPWSVLGLRYIDLRHKYYRHRLDIAAAMRDAADAWTILERIQARTFGSRLKRAEQEPASTQRSSDKNIGGSSQEFLDAILQLDLLEPNSVPTNKNHRQAVLRTRLLEKLRIEQAAAASVDTQQPPMTLDEAQSLIDSNTLALLFAAGNKAIHLVTLDGRGQIELSTLPADLHQIEARAGALSTALNAGPARHNRKLETDIHWLSEAVLRPISGRLDDAKRLVIVADAPLTRLPFGLLTHPRTDKFLIESHEIFYLPSLSVLALLRDRTMECPQPARQLLAVGDPFFGQRDEEWPENTPYRRTNNEALMFNRLEGSGEEARSIAKLYADDGTTILLRREATRHRFLAAAPLHQTIHIASHAQSNLEVAERSKIALSCMGAKGPVDAPCDLYLEHLASLELCGQLVVLSACSTADGPVVFGEGILGLPRAFLRSGASAVIASQWPVADQPTAKLMTNFHRHLKTGKSPAGALRQAKRDMILQGADILEWAAFVVLGDGEALPKFNLSAESGSHESTDGSQDP